MLSYLELIRPVNCIMASIGIFIGGLLVIHKDFLLLFQPEIYLGMLAGFLITGAGNAINDYRDVDADRINRPQRPIPSGRVSKKGALIFSIILFIAGILITGFLNWVAFGIAIMNSLLLIVYTYYFQDKMFLGNLIISYLVGSTFLFGSIVMGEYRLAFILMLLASLSNFSREIIKDLEDIEGDKQSFLKKITTKVGAIAERFRITKKGVRLKYRKKHALFIAEFSLILAVLVSPLPCFVGILGYSYLFLVGIADFIFLWCIWKMLRYQEKRELSLISKRMKTGMALGLLAFLIGIFI